MLAFEGGLILRKMEADGFVTVVTLHQPER